MRYWVYILECSDGRYYTGTYRGDDPAIRASEHNTGKYPDAWTAKRLPVKLVWCSEFQRITGAIDFEQRIKRWPAPRRKPSSAASGTNSPASPKPTPGARLKSCPTAGEPALVVRRTRASLAAHHEGSRASVNKPQGEPPAH
jgi:putative endonuclease